MVRARFNDVFKIDELSRSLGDRERQAFPLQLTAICRTQSRRVEFFAAQPVYLASARSLLLPQIFSAQHLNFNL